MEIITSVVNVSRAQFEGSVMGHSSYLKMTPPSFIREHFELKFHLVTDDSRQVALLFYIGSEEADVTTAVNSSSTSMMPPTPTATNQNKAFMAVSFIRGHIALTWDLGSGTRRIFTARPIAVNLMGGHSVHLGRRGR